MPFVTYTNATCLISSTWNRPILMNLKYKCFLGALSASVLLSRSQICVGVRLPSLRQWMLSGGENLFSLTSEEKREPSHGFPPLLGCEALIALGMAQLGVAVSFPCCPYLLCRVHRTAAPRDTRVPTAVCPEQNPASLRGEAAAAGIGLNLPQQTACHSLLQQ